MFEVHFIAPTAEPLPNLPHITAGLTARKFPSLVTSVLVENAGQPVMTINIFGNSDHYFFQEETVVWNNWVVVGVGHQVTFVSLADHTSRTTDLGAYFGYLYPTADYLLVASAQYVHCFGRNANLHWLSQVLGIDGVIIQHIDQGIMSGLGEWDPPGRWKPFKLSLATGHLVS